ncbi:MAG TPA: ABC transporter ATP-binding protein/permease [Candidatus Stackebrandtia faecavium]|nr:ABC transporter ATP-binding protein/permease [Candidatus Stackebrandtia faecavium]
MDEEISSRRILKRGLRVMGKMIRLEPGVFTIGAVGAVVHSVATLAGAFISGAIVDRVVAPSIADGEPAIAGMAIAVVALVALTLVKIGGLMARRLGAGSMQFRLQARHRRRVTRQYLDLPMSWHQKHSTGKLLSNANADVEAAFVPVAPLPFAVGTLIMLVVAIVAMFVTDWALALVGVAVFPALFLLNVMYARWMSPRMARAQHLRAEVSSVGHESFDGALIVKTMGREDHETQRFNESADELRDSLIRVGRLRGLFDPLMSSLPELGTLAVLLVGVQRLSSNAIGVQEIVSITFLFSVMAFPIRAITWVLGDLPRSVVGWERVYSVLEERGAMTYGQRHEDDAVSRGAHLEFENVSYAYDPSHPVLTDVTLSVDSGKTVALVGATGSGKSTIASLAARLVDPTTGTVSLDGRNLKEYSHAALAETTALVPQLAFVFDDNIRDNVAMGRAGLDKDDDAAVWDALKIAQADGFVSKLPDGLDTQVGERGASLSGGQRQRITLARALAAQPRLLVMDDATSAVDPKVEAAILAAMRNSSAPTSVLVVAYRRATIGLADEVIFLEDGEIKARGPHPELLATVPAYAQLVTAYERAEAERAAEGEFDEPQVSTTSEVSA